MRPARVALMLRVATRTSLACVNPPILGRADDPPNPSLQRESARPKHLLLDAREAIVPARNTSCSAFEKRLCRMEKSNPRAALKMSKFIIVAGVAHPPCV